MGSKADGSDSQAVEIAPASHWPTMKALILVASAEKKGVSSTSGMQTTVATSDLFKRRAEVVVPKHMEQMIQAVKDKNFELFGEITMKDSNSFHATCLDTFPPIFYLNDTSRAAIRVVEAINEKAGKIIAAYTFDAGPNCVIYFEEKNMAEVAGTIKSVLGNVQGWEGKEITAEMRYPDHFDERAVKALQEGLSRVIFTGVGEGPISVKESLIKADGTPLREN